MVCRDPDFPEIVFTTSDCGKFKYYKDEKFFIIVFLATSVHHGLVLIGFYRGSLSNFSSTNVSCNINGTNVAIYCGEQAFKAACVVVHFNNNDASYEDMNLDVLKVILNGSKPTDAKFAPKKLTAFDSGLWDQASPDAMYKVQLLKFTDPDFRAFLLKIAQIAKDHDVDAEHCFFAEAAGAEDRIWGTGPGANMDELFSNVCKEGNTIKLFNNLSDPKKRREPEDCIFVGLNGLGKAIDKAFRDFVGKDFECFSESTEQFVSRVRASGGFDLFEYNASSVEPAQKRICKGVEPKQSIESTTTIDKESPLRMECDEQMPYLAVLAKSEEQQVTRTLSGTMTPVSTESDEPEANVVEPDTKTSAAAMESEEPEANVVEPDTKTSAAAMESEEPKFVRTMSSSAHVEEPTLTQSGSIDEVEETSSVESGEVRTVSCKA